MTVTVLLVCGSGQSHSANRAALDVVADHLGSRDGVVVTRFDDVHTLPVFHPDREPIETVRQWRAVLAAATVVVIAAPEYAGGLAGGMKNALDWIVGSAELYRKPVAVISAGTSGGEHARRQAVRTLTWQGAHVVAELGIAAPRTKSDGDGRYTDATTIAAIQSLVSTTIDAATSTGRLALVTQIVTAAGIDVGHIAPLE